MLKLYNTLTRKKENFKEIEKGKVGFYSCGPTVYNYCHIGNLRFFLIADLLKRILIFDGFKVKHVMNITDVDDKTIKGAIKEKTNLKKFTEKYEKIFLNDIQELNIVKPDVMPRATEHIKEIVSLIKKLIDKGYAYKAEDGIYFSVSKFKDYGKLAGLHKIKVQKNRVKNDEYDKENLRDFALWKFYSDEDGDVFWNTEIGKGRPGWHIECSAMSTRYLGETFDIHAGGSDLIFPHHTNEIAQSEAASGKKFVNYWVHGGFLTMKEGKMSKSLGNIFTLKDLNEKGFSPLDYRYLILTSHYRGQLLFTEDTLKNAKNSYERLKNILSNLEDDGKTNEKYIDEFSRAINDDLDMPKALQILWNLIRDKKAEGKYQTIRKMDEVFGLKLFEKEEMHVPEEVSKLKEEREKARKNKDWKKADELREKIIKLGYYIDDTEKGGKIKKL
jgi:cysteinyl-tRNA synthetase